MDQQEEVSVQREWSQHMMVHSTTTKSPRVIDEGVMDCRVSQFARCSVTS